MAPVDSLGATREAAGGSGGGSGGRSAVAAADVAALVCFAALAAFYLSRLDAWLINDDEGSYLYAAWRISLGEVPYRDFLTPQLPAFLLPGGLLMRTIGTEAWPVRALAAALTLGAGLWTWAAARRLFSPAAALLAGSATLLHPLLFGDGRTYRPDPFMLFFATLGVLLFSRAVIPRRDRGDPPDRAWLVAAGVAFGVAILSKLFGVLPLGACLAWLATDAVTRGRRPTALAADILVTVGSAAAVIALVLGAFAVASGGVLYEAVLGHHLMQGAGLSPLATTRKGLVFYTEFLRVDGNGLLFFVALAAAVTAFVERLRPHLIFAWQLPTALVFLLLTRQLFTRHLGYLIPALATLFALAVVWLRREDGEAAVGRWSLLAWSLAAGLLVPWMIADWHRSFQWEAGTERLGDFVQLVTVPDELVLADYSELNFYAQRPTTYSAASLSEGAARSGQITWDQPGAPHRIHEELGGALPPLVLVDRASEFSQLGALQDVEDFRDWLGVEYGPPAGQLVRHHQVYDTYAPRDAPLPTRAAFAPGPTLLAAGLSTAAAAPGESLDIVSAWRSDRPIGADLVASAVLVDAGGRQWAASDRGLFASGPGSGRVRPTSAWAAGELTADRTPLLVPDGTPPGTYTVRLGLYDPATLQRLEAFAVDGSPLGQLLTVGDIAIGAASGAVGTGPAGLDERVDASAGAGALLLGRGNLPAGAQPAGQTIDLDLWWRASGTAGDLSSRLTLSDPETGSIAADRTEALGVPGAGSSTWPREAPILVRQRVRLPVRADAGSGTFRLDVTLVDAAGRAVEGAAPIGLGSVEVVGRDLSGVATELPPVDRSLDAAIGDFATLVGLKLTGARGEGPLTSVAPGGELPVELVWRALDSSSAPYKVSVQLLDDSGRPAAQHDAAPADGARPFTGWLPGEVIEDRHVLRLPADLPPGTYRLVVAVYDPDTLSRVPASGSSVEGDGVLLGTVEVGDAHP